MPKLKDRVVMITGASRGIGAADARLFAQEGCRLVLTYSKNKKVATQVAKECTSLGAKEVCLIKLDVTKNKDNERAKKIVKKTFRPDFGSYKQRWCNRL